MKEITEFMQMRIFDLLEGNLSDAEKKDLLEEISKSGALQREYELMSKTYLKDDEEKIVFTGKQSLYRRTGLIITFNRRIRFAAAASVAMLATGVFSWYYLRNEVPSHTGLTESRVPEQQTIPRTNRDIQTETIQPETAANTAKFVTGSKKSSIPKIIVTGQDSQQTQPVIRQAIPEFRDMPMKTPEIKETFANFEVPVDTASHAVMDNTPIPVAKKRSLSYKLIHGGKAMLANLQLPDVKFITEKKSNKTIPTVKMAIRTYNTDVIATLIE